MFQECDGDKCRYDYNDETLFPFRQIKNVFHSAPPSPRLRRDRGVIDRIGYAGFAKTFQTQLTRIFELSATVDELATIL